MVSGRTPNEQCKFFAGRVCPALKPQTGILFSAAPAAQTERRLESALFAEQRMQKSLFGGRLGVWQNFPAFRYVVFFVGAIVRCCTEFRVVLGKTVGIDVNSGSSSVSSSSSASLPRVPSAKAERASLSHSSEA